MVVPSISDDLGDGFIAFGRTPKRRHGITGDQLKSFSVEIPSRQFQVYPLVN